MGPFRRQLILLCLMASPAMAGVCETYRVGWMAADGAATALTEAVRFLIWGGGGFVILGLLLGIYLRRSIILNGVMLVTLIMAVPYIWPLDATTHQLALDEGCVGAPTLVIGLLGVIWVAALGGTLLKRKPA